VVAVEQGNLLGTSFHPEMTGDTRFHQYFLRKIAAAQKPGERAEAAVRA
jgi:5'-phosphate synthase pdxT subunit